MCSPGRRRRRVATEKVVEIEPIGGGKFRLSVRGQDPYERIIEGTAALSRVVQGGWAIHPWMARWTLIMDWLREGATVLIDEIEKDGETAVRIRRKTVPPTEGGVILGALKGPAQWCARVARSGGIQITSGNGPATVSFEMFETLLRLVWGLSPHEVKAAMGILGGRRGAVLGLEEELRGTKGKVSSARSVSWPEESKPTGNSGGGKDGE